MKTNKLISVAISLVVFLLSQVAYAQPAGSMWRGYECNGSYCPAYILDNNSGTPISFESTFCGVIGFGGGFTSTTTEIQLVPNYNEANEYAIIGLGVGQQSQAGDSDPYMSVLCVPYSWFSPAVTVIYNTWTYAQSAGESSDTYMIANNGDDFCYLTGVKGKFSVSADQGFVGNLTSFSPDFYLSESSVTVATIYGSCIKFAGHHTMTSYSISGGSTQMVLPNSTEAFCAVTDIQGNFNYNISSSPDGEPFVGVALNGSSGQTLEVGAPGTNSVGVGVTCVNYSN
jgi:hypothetical protein